MSPKKQKWNESHIVESSKRAFVLLEKIYCDNYGQDENKDSVINELEFLAAQNIKHLKDVGHLSFAGLLSAVEIEYCAKFVTVRNSPKESIWKKIFDIDKHFGTFVALFTHDAGSTVDLDDLINNAKAKLADCNTYKLTNDDHSKFQMCGAFEGSPEPVEGKEVSCFLIGSVTEYFFCRWNR